MAEAPKSLLGPNEVPIISPDGTVVAVPTEKVPEAIRRGGKVGTYEDVKEASFGGPVGKTTAAGLGALETLTAGGSTAAAAEYGVLTGGQEKRQNIERGIKNYEEQNPISHIAGSALPLLAVPEAAGEAPLIAGESLLARGASFALPKFAKGVAEQAWLQGSAGVSEDILNHDLTAQSFYSHAATPEVLIGGALNVGIGAGLAKLKSMGTAAQAARVLGTEGELAGADAARASELLKIGQRNGMLSGEVSAAYAGMQDLAQQAAADPARRGFFAKVGEFAAKKYANGAPEVEAALQREYLSSVDRFAGADRVLDRTTREAVSHTDDMFKGLNRMNELAFGLKPVTVEKLIDGSKLSQQVDAALGLRRELGQVLDAALPKVDVRGGEVKRIWDVVQKLDGEIKNAASATAEASPKALAKAGAKLYVAMDDTKRVVGRFAKFGLEGKDGGAQLAEDIYERLFRPALEDEGLWGERLGQMQAQNNKVFSDGFASSSRFKSMVGQVLETPGGRKLYSTDFMRMRSVLSELEHATGPDDLVGLRGEIVKRVVENTRARATTMIETMDLAPSDVAQLRKTVESANKLEGVLKRAQVEQGEFRVLKELKAREMGGGTSGIIRSVTGVVTSPVRTMQMIGGLKRIEDTVVKAIGADAKAVMTGTKIPTTLKPIGEVERAIARKSMQDVQALSRDPHLLGARIQKLVGSLGDVSPKVASALSATAVRLVMHLASKVPPPLPAKFLDSEPRWAQSDEEHFYKQLSLGMKPLTMFERMQHNRLHADEQQLMESVFGDLYGEMRSALLKEYTEADKKGLLKNMSYQEKMAIALMLGTEIEGTQSADFIAAMQNAAMSDPNAQGAIGAQAEGGGRPRKIEIDVAALKTDAQKIGAGR